MLVAILSAALTAAPAEPARLRPAMVFPPRDPPAAFRQEAKDCPGIYPRLAEDWIARSRPRRLIELPPGRLELAVVRGVGTCPQPVILREDIGAQPQP